MNNYLDLISKSKIIKKSDTQITIPTYNSADITKQTIKKLLKQKNIEFDILLVDNGSSDYKEIIKKFPSVNYCLIKTNTGSSGAQRIGAEVALSQKYKYLIFTDNDALLLDESGLAKLKKSLEKKGVVAVVPKNIDSIRNINNKPTGKTKLKGVFQFHYLFVKTSALKKTGLHNFYIFLSGDDASMILKLLSLGKVVVNNDVLFYHSLLKPHHLQNKGLFLSIRSYLMISIFERNIEPKWRLYAFKIFLVYLFRLLAHSIIFLDFTCIKTAFFSIFYSFANHKKIQNILAKIPENKYVLKEVNNTFVSVDNDNEYVNLLSFPSFWLLPKKSYIYSNYLNKKIYFHLIKQ